MTTEHPRRLSHTITSLVAGTIVLTASLIMAGGIAAATPTQTQINATKTQVAQLQATLTKDQQQSAALSQAYDAAQAKVNADQAALAATQANLAAVTQSINTDKVNLAKAALSAYILGSAATAITPIFTSSANSDNRRQEYQNTAIGDLVGDETKLKNTQATLESDQNAEAAAEAAAKADAAQVASLVQQNNAITAQTQAALKQVSAKLGGQLAQQAAARARSDAASARAATSYSVAEGFALDAAKQLQIVRQYGSSALIQTATNSANAAAAAAARLNGSGGGSAGGSGGSSAAGLTAAHAAVSQLGVPYVWGGESPGHGFDCSGLTQWAWAQAGISIPRVAATQWRALPHVPLTSLQPGDLLFYYNLDGDHQVDHVVMYVGSGPYGANTIIQAPYTGAYVSYDALYTFGLIGAGRP